MFLKLLIYILLDKDPLKSLKNKELANAYQQLSIYQQENEQLKQKMEENQNSKETVHGLTQKLKELENSNDHLAKEIK